jgi:uncharacterized protein (TIGR02284 family)
MADIKDGLTSLYTRAVDARRGYEEALEQAHGHGLTSLFQDMIATHTTNATELSGHLKALGEQPDPGGSFMGTVHSTIMDIRGLFGGLGESVLPGLIDGEQRNVARYNEVLGTPDIPHDIGDSLQNQRGRIETMLTAMQQIDH